ncbi:hypothetical protein EGR_00817 [Echinococcus granulosus]|uniref:Uncharacterized protein n=1 Tax=Echinococcus granulosus TaxID=6210 RepID=W6USL6_ECHGR|nr:hypothetical protein EGR_00817 [Echinococcus granulosus]EUB64273.1 hypothetical protein EGR_00817 [Echinococcus granulosus]
MSSKWPYITDHFVLPMDAPSPPLPQGDLMDVG